MLWEHLQQSGKNHTTRDVCDRDVTECFLCVIGVNAKRTLDGCFVRPTLGFFLQIIPLLKHFIESRDLAKINLCLLAYKRFGHHTLKLMY